MGEHFSVVVHRTPLPPSPALPDNVVRSSVTNAEHIDPSHNIKDIIKQHQPGLPLRPSEIARSLPAPRRLALGPPSHFTF